MKYTEKKFIEIDYVVAVSCDVCRRTYDNVLEIQSFTHIVETGSYGSIFGDGVSIQCDICQHCLNDKLGTYLRLEEHPNRA